MTTTITIDAHCDSETTEVKISTTGLPDVIIQDGESHSACVYDDVMVTVAEVDKVAQTEGGNGPGGCEKCD